MKTSATLQTGSHVKGLLWSSTDSTFSLLLAQLKRAARGGFPLPLTNAVDQRTAVVRRLKKKMMMMIKQMLAVQ